MSTKRLLIDNRKCEHLYEIICMEFIIKCLWMFPSSHRARTVQVRSSYQIPIISSSTLLNLEIQTCHWVGANNYIWFKDKYICTHFADKFKILQSNCWVMYEHLNGNAALRSVLKSSSLINYTFTSTRLEFSGHQTATCKRVNYWSLTTALSI